MSNSSRIEAATRQHVGATLTSTQIQELVKLSDPTSSKGVYPSDCAGKRLDVGTLTYRGKQMYGDLVLEYVSENNFKVLPTDQIVRRKPMVVKKDAAPVPAPAPTPAAKAATGKNKPAKSSSQPPSATKSKANLARQVQ
jgi:hypothetical protein